MTGPRGIAWDGTQLVLLKTSGNEIWTLADVASPGDAESQGGLPSGMHFPSGMTWDETQLVIVETNDNEIWTLAPN